MESISSSNTWSRGFVLALVSLVMLPFALALPAAVFLDYGTDFVRLAQLYPSQLLLSFYLYPAIVLSLFAATLAADRSRAMCTISIGIAFGFLVCGVDYSRANRLIFMMPNERGYLADAEIVLSASGGADGHSAFRERFAKASRSSNLLKRLGRYSLISLIGIPMAALFLPYSRDLGDRRTMILCQSISCLLATPFFPMRLYNNAHVYPRLFGIDPIGTQAFDLVAILVVVIGCARLLYSLFQDQVRNHLAAFTSICAVILTLSTLFCQAIAPAQVVRFVDTTFGLNSDPSAWILLGVFPVLAIGLVHHDVKGKMQADARAPSQHEKKERTADTRFVVAFSFPGTFRTLVEAVASELADTYTEERVLYDRFHEEEFAQPNLDTILPDLYLRDSFLVVVVVCKHYVEREWTGLEWRKIREHIMANRGHRIMLIRTDDVSIDAIPGLTLGDGFLDVGDRTPEDLAALIRKRISRITRMHAETSDAPESPSRSF